MARIPPHSAFLMAEICQLCEPLMTGWECDRLDRSVAYRGEGSKMLLRSTSMTCLLGAVVVGAGSAPAHAYLDPGTGSMILQVLLGGIAGAAVAGRSTGARSSTSSGWRVRRRGRRRRSVEVTGRQLKDGAGPRPGAVGAAEADGRRARGRLVPRSRRQRALPGRPGAADAQPARLRATGSRCARRRSSPTAWTPAASCAPPTAGRGPTAAGLSNTRASPSCHIPTNGRSGC